MSNSAMKTRKVQRQRGDDHDAGPGRVVMIHRSQQSPGARWTGLKRKRRLVWHNDRRNAAIAAVAAAIADRNKKALRQYGLRLNHLPQRRDGKRVIVLVESTEHGRSLLALLRHWEMLDAVPVEYEDAPDPDEDGDEGRRPAGHVVTLVYAARYGIMAGIMIRATGGKGKLPDLPKLVIDFDDADDDQAQVDTHVRMNHYRQQGLVVMETVASENNER